MFVRNLGNSSAEYQLWLQMKAAIDGGRDINDVQAEWQQTRGITPGMFWRIFETYFNAPNNDPSLTAPNASDMVSRASDLANQGLGFAQIVNTIAGEVGRSYDYVQAALNSAGFVMPQRPEVLPPGAVDISLPGPTDPLNGFTPDEIARVAQIVIGEGFREGAIPQEVARRTRADYGLILTILAQAGIDWQRSGGVLTPNFSNDLPSINLPAAPQQVTPTPAPPPPAVTVSAPAPAPYQSPVQSVNTGGGALPGSGGGWAPSPGYSTPPPPGGSAPGMIPGSIPTDGTIPSQGVVTTTGGGASQPGATTGGKSAAGLLILAALALLSGQ